MKNSGKITTLLAALLLGLILLTGLDYLLPELPKSEVALIVAALSAAGVGVLTVVRNRSRTKDKQP